MTADKFRSLALSIAGAVESAHMGHPDFRIAGKIFATLGYPNEECGMVKLTPAQQQEFLQCSPEVFTPCSGAWGRQGATQVSLKPARVALIREALDVARQNVTAQPKGAKRNKTKAAEC
jgi:hypothetical protein